MTSTSFFITDRDPIVSHDQRPTHRPVSKKVSDAKWVEAMAWDAADHLMNAIHADESWIGLTWDEMYEAYQLAHHLAENAGESLRKIIREDGLPR